jgi:predicted Zn-dependent peptidase
MKHLNYLLLFVFNLLIAAQSGFAQKSTLEIERYTLDNGLTVVLNPDKTMNNVLCAISINSGMHDEPWDSGLAHYLEHMLFNGSDKIGTINWAMEKPLLDSIKDQYELLRITTIEKDRQLIQTKINLLSIEASKYSITAEGGRIRTKIGEIDYNGYTDDLMTTYYGIVKEWSVDNWFLIYSELLRFQSYRGFQAEIENVYEEKNMWDDDFYSYFEDNRDMAFFDKSPLKNSGIGSTFELQNPSIIKMEKFVEEHYVANNMVAIVMGNFDSGQVKKIIEKRFGNFRTGEVPESSDPKEDAFIKNEIITQNITPYPYASLGYRANGYLDSNYFKYTLITLLLANNASTGILDRLLETENFDEIYAEYYYSMNNGALFIDYSPTKSAKHFASIEEKIVEACNKLVEGDFSDDFLLATKLEMIRGLQIEIEDPEERLDYFAEFEAQNRKATELNDVGSKINSITKEEVVELSKAIFKQPYQSFRSENDSEEKIIVAKPKMDPLINQNADKWSEFAKGIIPNNKGLGTVDNSVFENVSYAILDTNLSLYYSKNKLNDIFQLKIDVGIGQVQNKIYEVLVACIPYINTPNYSYIELSSRLQKLGALIELEYENNRTSIILSGFDSNFKESLDLCLEIFSEGSIDEEQLKTVKKIIKSERKSEKEDVWEMGYALADYALYRDMSEYLERYSVDEISKVSTLEVNTGLRSLLLNEMQIKYNGTIAMAELETMMKGAKSLQLNKNIGHLSSISKPLQHKENTIYLVHDKAALQSMIFMYKESGLLDLDQMGFAYLYGEYLYDIAFDVLRTEKSLAYAVYGYFDFDFGTDRSSELESGFFPQSDKTMDMVDNAWEILQNMPFDKTRFDEIKLASLLYLSSNEFLFRDYIDEYERYKTYGIIDTREDAIDQINDLTLSEFESMYNEIIVPVPMVITIYGNTNKFDKEELKKYGKVIELKKSDIIK